MDNFSADNLIKSGWSALMGDYFPKAINSDGNTSKPSQSIEDVVASIKNNPSHAAGNAKIDEMTNSMSETQKNPLLGSVGNFLKSSGFVVFGAVLVILAIVQGVKNGD